MFSAFPRSAPGVYLLLALAGLPLPFCSQCELVPTPPSPPAEAGLWTVAPRVDGACGDEAYQHGTSASLGTGSTAARAFVAHDDVDAYFCFTGLPRGSGRRGVIRVSLAAPGTAAPSASELLAFALEESGALRVTRGAGSQAPVSTAAQDEYTAAWTADGAELRLPLAWLGGYGRTLGMALAIEGPVAASWPANARPDAPATWAPLTLGPSYPDKVAGGSLFLDGKGSYLALPSAPELAPRELTIEAWVRLVGDSCGTLIGSGRADSYWLGLCPNLQFTPGGTAPVSGERQLDQAWHHIAVTVDGQGTVTYFIDGERDARWKGPGPAAHGQGQANASAGRAVRIGSDRDAPPELNALHAYVHDLRLWSRARTADELRRDAFRPLTGKEPGLVALWPFTEGLRDIAGGHDGGLVGSLSLARAQRDVTAFPQRIPPAEMPRLPVAPPPEWDRVVPRSTKSATLDGICAASEYDRATSIRLEPGRDRALLTAMVGPDAIYLCTGPVFGEAKRENAVTVWLAPAADVAQGNGTTALRVRAGADGQLIAARGDGQGGFSNPAPQGLESRTKTDTRLDLQDDLAPVEAPWWSTELRIPLSALPTFTPGQGLQLAVRYESTLPATVPVGAAGTAFVRAWPAQFSDAAPQSWGSTTSQASAANALAWNPDLPLSPLRQAVTRRDPTSGGSTAWAPSLSLYGDQCPERKTPLWVVSSTDKWPAVDPGHNPIVTAEGVMNHLENSPEDSMFIHYTHDVDMYLAQYPAYDWLNIGASAGETVMESEQGGFPPGMRPRAKDHVTAKGYWIFDCGHAPKTEVHPVYAIESDREVVVAQWKDGPLRKAREGQVWMNPWPGWAYNIGDLNVLGPFEFNLQMPKDTGKLPFLRLVEYDMNYVPNYQGCTAYTIHPEQLSLSRTGDRLHVTIAQKQYPEDAHDYLFLLSHLDGGPAAGTPAGVQSLLPADFWGPRTADEPNDPAPRSLGELALGSNGSWATPVDLRDCSQPDFCHLRHDSYLTEGVIRSWTPAWGFPGSVCPLDYFFLAPDVDQYEFTLNDFADVTVTPGKLPANVTATLERVWPGYDPGAVPKSVQDKLGFVGGRVTVRSTTGKAGDVPYSLHLDARRREIPSDGGPSLPECGSDMAACSRLVDVTSAPPAKVDLEQVTRSVTMPWAWQAKAGDIHLYDVRFPPPSTVSVPATSACDILGSLVISAPGEVLVGPDGSESLGTLTLSGGAISGGGDLMVRVKNPTGRRSLYRLSAHWNDTVHISKSLCDTIKHPRVPTPISASDLINVRWWWPGPGPDPGPNWGGAWSHVIDLPRQGNRVVLQPSATGELTTVVASEAGRPVTARLYDSAGVLVAESTPLPAQLAMSQPEGLVPQGVVSATRLTPGESYTLKITPAFQLPQAGHAPVHIGLTRPATAIQVNPR